MDFKVSVSLWNQAQASANPPTQPDAGARDFKQRLGLDQQQSAPRQEDNGRQQGDTPLAEPPLPQGQQPASNLPEHKIMPEKVDPAAGLELYALGLQAGSRLSHVPAGLLASAEAAYRANAFGALAQAVGQEQPVSTTATLSPIASAPDHAPAGMVPATTPLTDAADTPLTRLDEGLGAWHSARWPQRNYLLLPRGDGVELLIRDHHLDTDEQATLLGELLRRLPGSGVDAQRIWINGHPVWQREPLSRLQGDA